MQHNGHAEDSRRTSVLLFSAFVCMLKGAGIAAGIYAPRGGQQINYHKRPFYETVFLSRNTEKSRGCARNNSPARTMRTVTAAADVAHSLHHNVLVHGMLLHYTRHCTYAYVAAGL